MGNASSLLRRPKTPSPPSSNRKRLAVHALPTELWLLIFRLACAPIDVYHGLGVQFTLSHVCSWWRALVLDDPIFWQAIGVTWHSKRSLGYRILPHLLTRSRNAPLQLAIHTMQQSIAGDGPTFQNSLSDVLIGNFARLTELYLDFDPHYASILRNTLGRSDFQRGAGRRLKRVTLKFRGHTDIRLSVSGATLEALTLQHVIATTNVGPMLRELNLLYAVHDMKADELVYILDRCPALEALRVGDVSGELPPSPETQVARWRALALHTLHLGSILSATLFHLLSCLRASRIPNLRLTLHWMSSEQVQQIISICTPEDFVPHQLQIDSEYIAAVSDHQTCPVQRILAYVDADLSFLPALWRPLHASLLTGMTKLTLCMTRWLDFGHHLSSTCGVFLDALTELTVILRARPGGSGTLHARVFRNMASSGLVCSSLRQLTFSGSDEVRSVPVVAFVEFVQLIRPGKEFSTIVLAHPLCFASRGWDQQLVELGEGEEYPQQQVHLFASARNLIPGRTLAASCKYLIDTVNAPDEVQQPLVDESLPAPVLY